MQPGNPVVGGVALRRPAIQSPNYQQGSLGWSINQDGTAEFNSGVFRGPVLIGGSSAAAGVRWLGLTPTSSPAIPSALLNFSADYTWYVADIYWISATDFFFSALVLNTAFSVTEEITGLYRTASGVQIQTLVEGTSPNTLNFGSTTYDTSRLSMNLRQTDLGLSADSSFSLDAASGFTIGGVDQVGQWASYGVAWNNSGTSNTLGNGSLLGRSHQTGKTWTVFIRLVWGSTTAAGTGSWQFTLPFTPHNDSVPMTVFALDASAVLVYPCVARVQSTGITLVCTSTPAAIAGGAVPFTWTTSDTLSLIGTIEQA